MLELSPRAGSAAPPPSHSDILRRVAVQPERRLPRLTGQLQKPCPKRSEQPPQRVTFVSGQSRPQRRNPPATGQPLVPPSLIDCHRALDRAGPSHICGSSQRGKGRSGEKRQVSGKQQHKLRTAARRLRVGQQLNPGPQARHRPASSRPLTGQLNPVAQPSPRQLTGQPRPLGPDQNHPLGTSLSRSADHRASQTPAADLDQRLVGAAESASPAAGQHDRREPDRRPSRQWPTSAGPAAGSRDR